MCAHHWLCESPTYKVVAARCKLCGASKEFPAVPKEIRLDTYAMAKVKIAKRRESEARNAEYQMSSASRGAKKQRAAARRSSKAWSERTVVVEPPAPTMTPSEEKAWVSMAKDGTLRQFTGAHCGRAGQVGYLAALAQRMADIERTRV